jgi:hypothetical protein
MVIYNKYVKTTPPKIDPKQLKKDIDILKALILGAAETLTAITSVATAGQSLGENSRTKIRNAKTLLDTVSKKIPKP